MFEQFTERGIIYVTKMKKNLIYKTLSNQYRITPDGLVSMRISIVEFSKDDIIHKARIIEYWEKGKKDSVRLLTNDMDFEPEQIKAIYDRRWQIELLFKQLKQNFQLRYFYGESVNAIETQIWVTMIANLLLTVVHKRIHRKWAFSNMVTMVRQMLMYYIDIYAFLEDPEAAWKHVLEGHRPPPTDTQQLLPLFE